MLIVYVCAILNLITMKDIKHLIIIPFLCTLSIATISSQEKFHSSKSLIKVDIDTLSYLKINKVIYYKDPLELEYNFLTDTTFIPKWYNAYCVNCNIEHFNNCLKDAKKYIYRDSVLTASMLQDYNNEVKTDGGTKARIIKSKFLFESYLYIFGETWLTLKKTGEQYVLIQGINSDHRFTDLRFSQPIKEKNLKNERTDSIKKPIRSYSVFINDNDTLKFVDQMHVLNDLLSNHNKYSVGSGDLANFKDIMFRAPIFIQSEIINGKRVFETMEKGKEGHIKTKESNKP